MEGKNKQGNKKRKENLEGKVTWGMMNEGFQSLPGIPDDFCSAEDPRDRVKLWNERQPQQQGYRDFYADDEPLYNNGKGDN